MKISYKLFMIFSVQIQVFSMSFWMAHFGAPTPKRTTVMSNSKFVGMLHMGPFTRSKGSKNSTTTRAFAFWVIFCDLFDFLLGKGFKLMTSILMTLVQANTVIDRAAKDLLARHILRPVRTLAYIVIF